MTSLPLPKQLFSALEPSNMAQALTEVLQKVRQQNQHVSDVVLSTQDGVMVAQASSEPHLAASAGYMVAATRQTGRLLGWSDSRQVVIVREDGGMMVCRIFCVNEIDLILTTVFTQEIEYESLVTETVLFVQTTFGNRS